MRKITDLLLLLAILFVIPSCSDDDDAPKQIDPQALSGEWYVTNVRGWEYDNDAKGGKSQFNETYNYNGQGTPVGDNRDDAQKIVISNINHDTENGSYFFWIDVTDYYWGFTNYNRDWQWLRNETETIKLRGNELIDGTMKATIIKLTETSMTTYQRDEDGETFVTYTRL